MGAREIDSKLPALIKAVQATNSPVLWVCDPMHGNTETAQGGLKTRRFENIVSELESAFRIHRELGTYLGGVHFELTGDDVTECTGGARGLTDADLARAYKSTVDPGCTQQIRNRDLVGAQFMAPDSTVFHRGAINRAPTHLHSEIALVAIHPNSNLLPTI
jgi:3-deoxy-D-arabino-heptulosonate 7-phosphate (DAHP) synthase class II